MFSAVLTTALGLSGWFDKLTRRIPLPIAAAMLAGIMLKFGLDIFTSMRTSPVLVLLMISIFLVAKRMCPRYAVPLVLLAGVLFCFSQQQLDFSQVELGLVPLVWVAPAWSWSAILGVGVPLFVVTMTSQNIPGLAVLRSSGYQTPVSPLLSWTGLITLVSAPFGNFSINLAAITAAICSGPEAHPDPAKRYTAGIAAGVFYLMTGLAGATVVALFAAFPTELIATVAGLALLGTIAANLATATIDVQHRDAAILTLLITASGVSFFGIASAFWGLIAGLATTGWFSWRRSQS
jgi:benzoate membrane transport protein